MSFSVSEIREQARDSLKGKYIRYFLMILGCSITGFCMDIFRLMGMNIVFTLASFIVSIHLVLFVTKANLNIVFEEDDSIPGIVEIIMITSKAYAIITIITIAFMLGFFLLVIPGIIALYALSQSIYILLEDSSKSVLSCILESVNMMKGNKLNLFFLQMSYLLDLFLCIVTFGIAGFWVLPRIYVASAHFYIYVSESYYNKEIDYNSVNS